MLNEFRKNFEETCNKHKDKNYFYFMRDEAAAKITTYEEMFGIIKRAEKNFKEIGLERGDRVAVISPVSPQTILTGFSLHYYGATAVLLDASLPIDEIKELLNFSDVRAVFTTDEIYNELKNGYDGELNIYKLIDDGKIESYNGNDTKLIKPKTIDPEEDVIVIIFSSGTTGKMKGIKVTYKSILLSTNIFYKCIINVEDGKILYVFPFNHIAGFVICHVFTALGWELGLIENMNASKLQKSLLEFNPHLFAIIPKVFEVMEQKIRAKLQEKGKFVEKGFNGLLNINYFFRRYFGLNIFKGLFKGVTKQVFGNNIVHVGGGGTMFKGSTARFYYSLGLEWSNVYASTETGVPLGATGVGDRIVVDTVGNVNKFPEIKVKIGEKDESGKGEILVKTELAMKGYFRQPELTDEAYDENGYFKTGDSGYIDKKGNLYIVGRIKESIVLSSGKKVSPSDVDSYYFEKLPDYEFASRGIESEDKQFDTIHLFIKNENYTEEEKEEIKSKFEAVSKGAQSMYQLSGIHFIENIEKTSIGKVKRFMLKIEDADKPTEKIDEPENGLTGQDKFIDIISKKCGINDIKMEHLLKEDLGIDSLTMYEIVVSLENAYHTTISTEQELTTVSELYEAVQNGSDKAKTNTSTFDLQKYPMEKTKKDIKKLSSIMRRVMKIWKFEVNGLENISDNESYIVCPNHESHFDGLFVFAAMNKANKVDISKVCCMAKKEHLDHKITRNWIKMLGGIPVDRYGVSAPSIHRCVQCVQDGKVLLIHPEGTRTRNGKLGTFKNGASKISEITGNKILPVRIDGAYEIYPYNKKLPKFFDWRHFRRHKLVISFGQPIDPAGKTEAEITHLIKNSIKEMKTKEV